VKTLTTLITIAALMAGVSIAGAQNMGGPAAPGASPSNINKGVDNSTKASAQSGSESTATAHSGRKMTMKKKKTMSTTGSK
jgi:hypothetical protein